MSRFPSSKGQETISTSISRKSTSWFVATQTGEKLRRSVAVSTKEADSIHRAVRKKVRQTIRELGGPMPENLPVAECIKKVASRDKKRLKEEQKQIKQEAKIK